MQKNMVEGSRSCKDIRKAMPFSRLTAIAGLGLQRVVFKKTLTK